MSKKVIYFFMLALSLTLFAGCGGDDDPEVTDYASQISATYNGTLIVKVGNVELTRSNSIILSRSNVNKVKFELRNLELPTSMFMPPAEGTTPRGIQDETIPIDPIVLDGIEVTKSGNDVVMKDKTIGVTLSTQGTPLIPASLDLSQAKVSGNTLTLKINVPAVGVEVSFTGTK